MSKLVCVSVLALLAALAMSAASAGGTETPVALSIKADIDGDKLFDDLESKLAAVSDGDSLRVVVVLKQAATIGAIDMLQDSVGSFELRHRYSVIPGFAATVTKAQAEALAGLPVVAQVEEDSKVSASNATAQASFGVTKARIDAGVTGDGDGNPNAYTKDDFVAAVIDSGIDDSHEDLNGGKVIGWNDFVNGLPDPYDDNDHGTHVAATIAGAGDARGDRLYRGAAYEGALVGVKVLDANGNGFMSDVTVAINWVVSNKATYGVEAINLSLGTATCSNGSDATSLAVNSASAAGIVVAVAAGNFGPGTCTIGSPGAAAGALTVGAMADTGTVAAPDTGPNGFYQAAFSSRGKTLDGRIKPDVSGPGVSITSADAGTSTGYVAFNGTSMATPFVAGVALLMLDANPALTPSQVKSTIMGTAIDWGRGGDNKTAGTTGQDIDYGAGRLDGYAAIETAKGADIGTSPSAPVHEFHDGTLGGTGQLVDFPLSVTSTDFPIAATLIIPSINGSSAASPNLDLRLYDPSSVQVASAVTTGRQDQLGYKPLTTGTYTLRVVSANGSGGFMVDVSGPLGVAGPDLTPPTVVSVSPADGLTNVARSTNVAATFSEAMNQASVQGAFSLRDPGANVVAGAFSWNGNTLTFNPAADLAQSTTYTARITTAANDLAGNALQSDKIWTFTTAAAVTSVTDFADAAIVDKGTVTGTLARLQANDNSFYQVNGTSTQPRETQWRGLFTGVPAGLTSLKLVVRDKCSGASTRTIEVYNVVSGTWVVLDQRSLAGTETNLLLTPPGPASDYVDASGQLSVRLRTVRSGSLQRHRTDVLQAQYDVP